MSISRGDRSTHARHAHGPCGVAFAGEIIGQHHIAWPKAARRAIANANLHCPRQDEDILVARSDVPVTKPTVSLGVTYAVVCTYGCDDGRIAQTPPDLVVKFQPIDIVSLIL
jgi:hypothetical protein